MLDKNIALITCCGTCLMGYALVCEAQSRQLGTPAPSKAAAKAKPASAIALTEEFGRIVKPLLADTCGTCHNARLASGGLNLTPLQDPSTLTKNRDDWERIAKRLEAGEMPPVGVPREQTKIANVVTFLKNAFKEADANLPADPGRVVAHRLNRVEYSNTVRDLLGVSYRADREFPRDDEGEGFDNIADLLSMSPVLVEKYMSAARRIAARAMATEHLPQPTQFAYTANQDPKLNRRWPVLIQAGNVKIYNSELLNNYGDLAYLLDPSTLELKHRVEYPGEYDIHVELAGARSPGSPPVNVALMMDGAVLYEIPLSTGGRDGGSAAKSFDVRRTLPEGDHVFRVALLNDDFTNAMSEPDAYNTRKNVIPYGVKFLGPLNAQASRVHRDNILICNPADKGCVERILTRLAHRAYRRPVTNREIADLTQIVRETQSRGRSVEDGIQNAIRAILVSPNFLFRVERDLNPRDQAPIHPLSEIELASRLSYFLWSSMPDDELLGLAESGHLRAPGILEAQVKRMLADSKATALAENFAGQWLQLRNLDALRFDTDRFPEWEPAIKEAMYTETRMFFNYVFQENRPLTDFLTARYTFLNGPLTKYYGIPDVSGPDFRKVELKTDQRGGILMQGSVLAVSSYPTRTSIVLRGKYVLDNIFNTPPPPPPPNVPPLDEQALGESASLRQQMESHRANPVCASCHNRMDPIGFGLENFNAVGQWRTMDGKFPVDASGKLAGKSYNSPAEFRAALLAQTSDFIRAVTEKMLTYALGRGLTSNDKPAVSSIHDQLMASGYQSQTLVLAIVKSLPFDSRKGDDSRTQEPVRKKEIATR